MQRAKFWLITYYRFFVTRRHFSVRFRGIRNSWNSASKLFYCVKNGAFRNIRGKQASTLKENKLLLVHCVSKQPLVLIPDGLPCVELECREVHVSFMDSSDLPRLASKNERHLTVLKSNCNFRYRNEQQCN